MTVRKCSLRWLRAAAALCLRKRKGGELERVTADALALCADWLPLARPSPLSGLIVTGSVR